MARSVNLFKNHKTLRIFYMLWVISGFFSLSIGVILLVFSTNVVVIDLALRPFIIGGVILGLIGLWQIIARSKRSDKKRDSNPQS